VPASLAVWPAAQCRRRPLMSPLLPLIVTQSVFIMEIPTETARKPAVKVSGSSMVSHFFNDPFEAISNRMHFSPAVSITPYRLLSSPSIKPTRMVSNAGDPAWRQSLDVA
jgi:hypothetical protein